jgi:hypothetical protein
MSPPKAARRRLAAAVTALGLAVHAPAAFAYVGPGAGLGMIASLFAILLAVVATIVGVVLWPIRKLMRRRKAAGGEPEPREPEPPA